MIISALTLFASVASAAPMPYAARSSVAPRSMSPDLLFPRSAGSSPEAGTYIISNMVQSATGEKLVMTSAGQDSSVTVGPDTGDPSQRWIIGSGSPQSISPFNSPDLEASWGANVVSVSPAGDYVWNIMKTGNGYTIQDGGNTAFWGLESATADANVTIGGTGTSNNMQIWSFEKV